MTVGQRTVGQWTRHCIHCGLFEKPTSEQFFALCKMWPNHSIPSAYEQRGTSTRVHKAGSLACNIFKYEGIAKAKGFVPIAFYRVNRWTQLMDQSAKLFGKKQIFEYYLIVNTDISGAEHRARNRLGVSVATHNMWVDPKIKELDDALRDLPDREFEEEAMRILLDMSSEAFSAAVTMHFFRGDD